jgi:hypothetical protein
MEGNCELLNISGSSNTLLVHFFLVLLILPGCGGGGGSDSGTTNTEIGSTYAVYGGNTYNLGDEFYDPLSLGYTLIGTSTVTETFNGTYTYYLIATEPKNVAYVDTVQGSNNQYYATYVTGATPDYTNIGGPPDMQTAAVGGEFADYNSGGYFLIDATNDTLTSLTVYVYD